MTLVRLTTQARRVEGGHLIGRASRFSTGRAVTALKPNGYQPAPLLENSTLARGTQLPGMICSPPISSSRFSVSRESLFAWAETTTQMNWRGRTNHPRQMCSSR